MFSKIDLEKSRLAKDTDAKYIKSVKLQNVKIYLFLLLSLRKNILEAGESAIGNINFNKRVKRNIERLKKKHLLYSYPLHKERICMIFSKKKKKFDEHPAIELKKKKLTVMHMCSNRFCFIKASLKFIQTHMPSHMHTYK